MLYHILYSTALLCVFLWGEICVKSLEEKGGQLALLHFLKERSISFSRKSWTSYGHLVWSLNTFFSSWIRHLYKQFVIFYGLPLLAVLSNKVSVLAMFCIHLEWSPFIINIDFICYNRCWSSPVDSWLNLLSYESCVESFLRDFLLHSFKLYAKPKN